MIWNEEAETSDGGIGVNIPKGWKMRCEVILQRNEMRSEITKYYFHQALSEYKILNIK